MASFNNYHTVSNQAGTQIVNGNIIYHLEESDRVKDDTCLCNLEVTNPRYEKEKIEDTKDRLLQESFEWILDNANFKDWRNDPHPNLLWIRGDPGKGKTMLMIGLIDELSRQLELRPESEVLAYFFCQDSDDRLRSATSVLRGIIYLLASKKRNLIRHIREFYDKSDKALFKTDRAWYAMKAIFLAMLKDSSLERVYLVVDALDECDSGKLMLLELISASSSTSSKVKWLVSSRNELGIEERLRMNSSRAEISLELNSDYISRAVDAFILSRVEGLAKLKGYKDDLSNEVRNYLFAKAEKTFLWVALVCKALETTRARKPLTVLESFPSGLQLLYKRILQQIINAGDREEQEACKQILSSLRLTYRPIHLKELVWVADLDEKLDGLEKLLGLCGSFLTVREETIYFVHQTAKDYLVTSESSQILLLDRKEEHCRILAQSLKAMSGTLRKDICNLGRPDVLLKELKAWNQGPLVHVGYACAFWVDHLCQASELPQQRTGLSNNGSVHVFLKKHFLHWLEALSLMGMMSEALVMMGKIETLLRGVGLILC